MSGPLLQIMLGVSSNFIVAVAFSEVETPQHNYLEDDCVVFLLDLSLLFDLEAFLKCFALVVEHVDEDCPHHRFCAEFPCHFP